MIQWFFFDRVDAKTAGQAVTQQAYFIADSASDKAESALVLVQLAEARAEVALELAVFQSVPEMGGYAMVGLHHYARLSGCLY